MSKYNGLGTYLRNRRDRQVTLSFNDVNQLTHGTLPPSAFRRRVWWANERNGSHTQARAWLNSGYAVQRVEFGKQRVTFTAIGGVPEPAESATKSGTGEPNAPGLDTSARVVSLDGHPFRQVCSIQPKRGPSGTFLEFVPSGRYANVAGLSLNKYGAGPFCSFHIPPHHRESGVYALIVRDAVVYVGECVDLSARFNMGYGVISPRNCFTHGQETNCRINNLILTTARSEADVQLWFCGASERKRIEDELIDRLRPPWNR